MATRGRKKRTRRPGAGNGVKVRTHSRSPRGSNKGKPRVKVDPYRRSKPKKRRRRS